VECAAKQQEGAVLQPICGQRADLLQRAAIGLAFLRQRRYSGGSYRPMYWGTHDPYYDDYSYLWYSAADDDDHDHDDDDDDDDGFDDS
jgi:hypothetical protein